MTEQEIPANPTSEPDVESTAEAEQDLGKQVEATESDTASETADGEKPATEDGDSNS